MIYFLIYLFLEVYISISFFSYIGAFYSFVEIITSAFFGFILLVNFRYTLSESFMALRQRNISAKTFQTLNILTIIGAFLLILPGFLSDIMGVLMQFGFVTAFIKNRINSKNNLETRQYTNTRSDDEIIDVEVIDHNTH